MTTRTLVMGDVHGAALAMEQVLERARFDPAADRLIFLGDVVDGWPDTPRCIDLFLQVPDLVHLMGNHDEWALDWMRGRRAESLWLAQGGEATRSAYDEDGVPEAHRDFLQRAKYWHEEVPGMMFVHGGWPNAAWTHPRDHPGGAKHTWDRSLWLDACERHERGERAATVMPAVFIGHTQTLRMGCPEPVQRCEVWNLDQGAGWTGRLSLMDVSTKEFWQSDPVPELYPEAYGRRRAA